MSAREPMSARNRSLHTVLCRQQTFATLRQKTVACIEGPHCTCDPLSDSSSRLMKAMPTASCTALTAPESPAGRNLVANRRPVNLGAIIFSSWSGSNALNSSDNSARQHDVGESAHACSACMQTHFFSFTGLRSRSSNSSISSMLHATPVSTLEMCQIECTSSSWTECCSAASRVSCHFQGAHTLSNRRTLC